MNHFWFARIVIDCYMYIHMFSSQHVLGLTQFAEGGRDLPRAFDYSYMAYPRFANFRFTHAQVISRSIYICIYICF